MNSLQQCFGIKRVVKEPDSTGSKRPLSHAVIGVSRDENDRDRVLAVGKSALKLQSIHAWQMDVQDQTGALVRACGIYILLSR